MFILMYNAEYEYTVYLFYLLRVVFMKTAVIGSRSLTVDDLEKYIPLGTCEIVSGGAKGIDTCAHDYAVLHGLRLTEFLPE